MYSSTLSLTSMLSRGWWLTPRPGCFAPRKEIAVPLVQEAAFTGADVIDDQTQWPCGLRRGSAADRLLGLQVWIPPGAWMFVLHVKARGKEQDNQHTDEVQSTRDIKKSVSYGRCVLLGRGLSLVWLTVIMKTTTREGVVPPDQLSHKKTL